MKDEIQGKERDDDAGDQPDELNARRSARPDARRGAAGARPSGGVRVRLRRAIDAGLVRTVVGDRLVPRLDISHRSTPLEAHSTNSCNARSTSDDDARNVATIAVTGTLSRSDDEHREPACRGNASDG